MACACLRGRDQRFRRHAAEVEAVAAHAALLDQHHRHAERGRRGGDRQAARARADDADVRFQQLRHALPSGFMRSRVATRTHSTRCARPRIRFTRIGISPTTHEHGERRQQFGRERDRRIEHDPAIHPSGRDALLVGHLLGADGALQAGAEKRKREGRRDDADHGRAHEGAQAHAEQRRRQVNEPERKRHQPQEQHVAEGIGAKALGELGGQRTGAPKRDARRPRSWR